MTKRRKSWIDSGLRRYKAIIKDIADIAATVDVVTHPEDGDVGGRDQVTYPSEFPAGEIPDEQSGSTEPLYKMPRQAETGQELTQLTTEREHGKPNLDLSQHSLWNKSYTDENKFEDTDKLGDSSENNSSMSDAVYSPYTDGIGQPNPRYEDIGKEKYTVTLHASKENEEVDVSNDHKGDQHQLWVCVDLDDTLLASPKEYQDKDGNHLFGEILSGKSGGPGPREALQELIDGGARVSIFTARQYFDKDEEHLKSQVEEELVKQDIPFTDVYIGVKPAAHYFIDDKTIPPFEGDWNLVLDAVRDKLNKKAANKPNPGMAGYQVDNIHDIPGLDLDTDFRKVVSFLNQPGVKTYSTCQGHYDSPSIKGGLSLPMLSLVWTDLDLIKQIDEIMVNSGYLKDESHHSYITQTENGFGYQSVVPGGDPYGEHQVEKLVEPPSTYEERYPPVEAPTNAERRITFYFTEDLIGNWNDLYDQLTSIISKTANDPVKDTVNYKGIDIDIEWPKGSVRSYKGDDTYVTHMKCSYGYAKGIDGNDGEELDIYLGDGDSDTAYLIEQVKEDGSYDEDKIMLGFDSEIDAADMYLKHMPAYMLGEIRTIPIERLVNALYGDPEDRRGEEDQVPSEEKEEKKAFTKEAIYRDLAEKALMLSPNNPELQMLINNWTRSIPIGSDLDKLTQAMIANDDLSQSIQELIGPFQAEDIVNLDPNMEFNEKLNLINTQPIEEQIKILEEQKTRLMQEMDSKNVPPKFKQHYTRNLDNQIQNLKISAGKKKKTVKTKSDYVGPQSSQSGGIGGVGISADLEADIEATAWPGDDEFNNRYTDSTEDRENRDIPRPPETEKLVYG